MSTYWGYYCEDCKEMSSGWPLEQTKSLEYYYTLRQFMSKLNIPIQDLSLSIPGFEWTDNEIDEFYNRHSDHNLVLIGEYGVKKQLELSDKVKDSLLILQGKLHIRMV